MTTIVAQRTILMALLLLTSLVHGATERALEVRDRRLPLCPDSPNCVGTLDNSEDHAIAPYRYRKSLNEAKAVLKQVFNELNRTELVKEEDTYLQYEVRSFMFRFVDNVEFVFDDASKTIHFRSAARSGYYDFGVNRRRMEKVRGLLMGKL